MTATTTEIVTVDGVQLNTLAYNISTRAGRYGSPDVRTKNLEVGGRHGTLRVRGKKFQQAQFVWSMWVRGCNADGGIPDTRLRKQIFQTNLDMLMQLFTRRTGLLNIQQTLPDGSIRQCFGEVLAVIDPSIKSSNPLATFNVAITVPSAFWQDLNTVTYTSAAALTSQTLTLTPFIGATAPMEDLVWTITGAASNAKVQALENGSPLEIDTWMQFNTAIPSTDTLTVDCGAWTVAGVGFTPSVANLSHSGSARFVSIVPGPNYTAPQVAWSCTGSDSHTKLSVTGRRKYVVV